MRARQKCTEVKRCPICEETLSIESFGICRSRKDGRSLYCKPCARRKVYENRRLAQEYEAARLGRPVPQRQASTSFWSRKKPPAPDRVLEAIKQGAQTYSEIVRVVRDRWTNGDDVGNAIAVLLLDKREIRAEIVDGARHYFLREKPLPPTAPAALEPGFTRIPISQPVMRGTNGR